MKGARVTEDAARNLPRHEAVSIASIARALTDLCRISLWGRHFDAQVAKVGLLQYTEDSRQRIKLGFHHSLVLHDPLYGSDIQRKRTLAKELL